MPNVNTARPDKITGRCMCEAVTYEVTGAPIATALCHCLRCQPQSGSAFSQVVFLPSDGLVISGETEFFADVGTSGYPVRRRYCPKCGSPIVTELDFAPAIVF